MIFAGFGQACRGMPNISKITRRQYLWEVFFFLFVLYSYTSMEATMLSCCSSWIWSSMPKFIWNNTLEISLERVEWFCWFFALILYILLDIHWSYKIVLFQAGIVRHRLSARQIVRSFKLKKLENYMRYQIKFLLPLKL